MGILLMCISCAMCGGGWGFGYGRWWGGPCYGGYGSLGCGPMVGYGYGYNPNLAVGMAVGGMAAGAGMGIGEAFDRRRLIPTDTKPVQSSSRPISDLIAE